MGLIIVAIVFMILGILIKDGKKYNLIAGYNSLSKEEKKKFDIEKIASLFRVVMFGMAAILIIGYFLMIWLEKPMIEIISIFVAVGLGAPLLIFLANSKKYRKK